MLAPACDALTDPCLADLPIAQYDWAEGIALITIFVLFFIELMAMRFSVFDSSHTHGNDEQQGTSMRNVPAYSDDNNDEEGKIPIPTPNGGTVSSSVRGTDHLGHNRTHVDPNDLENSAHSVTPHVADSFAAQMTAVFILEFGVIFHSIFVGLTLAVAGTEFTTLYIVIIFHQTFEGLGLGSRLANAPWPKDRRWTPYILGVAYAFSTPVAIAIGLGIRETYEPGSATSLIVNGVFDSISAGILIYTGLVELMAHEFMFSESMRRASMKKMLLAFGVMVRGAGRFYFHQIWPMDQAG